MAGDNFPNSYFSARYFPPTYFQGVQGTPPTPGPTPSAPTVDRGYGLGHAVCRNGRRKRKCVPDAVIFAAVLSQASAPRVKKHTKEEIKKLESVGFKFGNAQMRKRAA